MKRSISAFEPGAVMESTAFPFRYSTSVGMTSIPSAPPAALLVNVDLADGEAVRVFLSNLLIRGADLRQ